jgi:hypothetical protein
VRSANTLRLPLTEGSTASIAVPIFSISAKSAPEISPTGVRMPVVSMSIRPIDEGLQEHPVDSFAISVTTE